MRTALLVAAALLLSGVYAQHGPRLGIGLASRSFGGLFQTSGDMLGRPIVGWHFEMPVHPQASIMPEILFMTKGFAARNPAQGTRSRSTHHFIEVPILAKVSLDKEEGGLFLLAGPSIGYALRGRYLEWLEDDLIWDIRMLPERRLEFSGLVGIGMESHHWAFDIRAQTSLTPFDRFNRIQNVVYAFTLAYRFRKAE